MELSSVFTLISLGFGVGIFSGLLGIGGGILMIPALLYLYPWITLTTIPFKEITGIAVSQGVAGSLSSSTIHYRKQNMKLSWVFQLGGVAMVGSYLGGMTSQFYPDVWIKILFSTMLLITLVMSLKGPAPSKIEDGSSTAEDDSNAEAIETGSVDIGLQLFCLGVGYISGVVGVGGALYMVPYLYSIKKIPIKLAIGTGSGIVALVSIAAFIGKLQAGQILWMDALWVTLGAIAGGTIGAKLLPKAPIKLLKALFFIFILASLGRFLWEWLQSA
ncbi:MAG: sulfite exporter TauE/SafE family protein [Cyanobacteria bacterium]|nr:sulfite exporter TauE/SafE family protein [Cyanobacteriota bacterium]